MNTQLHRVQPDEMPVQFVDSPSAEDEQDDKREIWITVFIVLSVLLTASFFAGWVVGTFF